MVAAFNDASVLQNHNGIRVADGGQTVCNNKHRSAAHQAVHAVLYNGFRSCINAGSGFVQNQNGRVGHGCTGNGKQLALALAEVFAFAGDNRFIAMRQTLDEAVGIRQTRCGIHFFVSGIQTAIADVLHNGAGKQVGILQNNTQAAAQVILANFVDVNAVVADFSVLNVIETVDQVGNRRFACTGRADKRQLLAGLCIQCDVMQNGFFRGIAKRHILKTHIAAKAGICHAAVAVRMLPCPNLGTLGAFHQLPVMVVTGIHQSNIAFVGFLRFIHHIKNALCTGKRHDNGVHLLRNLAERHNKVAGKLQERSQRTQRNRREAADGQNGTNQRGKHILQVADIADNGHQHVAISVGRGGALAKLLVQHIKVVLGGILVVKYFNHFLSGHHFFDIAVYFRQVGLLGNKASAALAADILSDLHHEQHHQHCQNGQRNADAEHHTKNCHHAHQRVKRLRNALADHLTQCIGIVGVKAHDFAVGMGVKIADGQPLHVGKHLITHTL